jgi:hypothetical protein
MLAGWGFGWTHTKPNSVAPRVFFQISAGAGGFQRIGPVGGRAYGIPLNTWMPPTAVPRSLPAGAATRGADSGAANGHEPDDAATNNKTMNRFMLATSAANLGVLQLLAGR